MVILCNLFMMAIHLLWMHGLVFFGNIVKTKRTKKALAVSEQAF